VALLKLSPSAGVCETAKVSTAEPGQPMQRQKHWSGSGGASCEAGELGEPANVCTEWVSSVDRISPASSQGSDEMSTAISSAAAVTLLIVFALPSVVADSSVVADRENIENHSHSI